VNQIGTITDALEAYRLARSANWRVTVSACSGETEDDWLADLAVGWDGDQIKIGSITQSERLSLEKAARHQNPTESKGPW
jgi:enolase